MSVLLKCNSILRLTRNFIRNSSSSTKSNKGLVLGVYSDNERNLELTPAAEQFNLKTNGKLWETLNRVGDLGEGKAVQLWEIADNDDYKTIAVVGLGKKAKGFNQLERICDDRHSVRQAATDGCKLLQPHVQQIDVESFDGQAEAAAEGATLATWQFQAYKTKRKPTVAVQFYDETNDAALADEWCRGVIKANGQNTARRLMETPANLMTPTIFVENVYEMFKERKATVDVRVYDEKWACEQKMFAFLAVGKGSIEPSKFLEITYNGGDGLDVATTSTNSKPIVLIGKGVTFDAGGISIKPSAKMDEMRADMGGAATVIGTLEALAALNVRKQLKVLIPLVENLPSGAAIKPGDVVYAMNGKSICVDNTDAEGRLILADALCYSAQYQPKLILDIATLTGAVVVALGEMATGCFTNSDSHYERLEAAGARSGDRVWRMPLWKAYATQMTDYKAYDVNNVGKGKGGGACTAAAFLSEFAPAGCDWMHLDMAGVMISNSAKCGGYIASGMTGRPTRTLIEFITALE